MTATKGNPEPRLYRGKRLPSDDEAERLIIRAAFELGQKLNRIRGCQCEPACFDRQEHNFRTSVA